MRVRMVPNPCFSRDFVVACVAPVQFLQKPLVLVPKLQHLWRMEELMRTNNPVTISFVESLLTEAEILYFVADQHMSIVEGSLGILPKRIMIDGDRVDEARSLMVDAGIGAELPTKPVRPRV